MTKRPAKNQTIHCDICGEDYAATYKRCPFCEGLTPEEQEKRYRGGKRMASNTRGGGYSKPTLKNTLVTILSLALIVAAVCIVVSILMPLIGKGGPVPSGDPSPSPVTSSAPTPSPTPGVPADQTATGLTLDHTDFTISDQYPNPVTIRAEFLPAGSVGYVEWTTSDESVAKIEVVENEDGTSSVIVTGGARGQAIITATLAGGGASAECIVNCRLSG